MVGYDDLATFYRANVYKGQTPFRGIAGGRNSPPWDLEDKCEEPSTISGVGTRALGLEDGVGRLPLLQDPVVKVEEDTAYRGDSVSQIKEVVGGKSTPSTLSDNADEEGVVEQASGKLSGQSDAVSKKRAGPKGRDVEEAETSEEGQDLKRKPRKSARLA